MWLSATPSRAIRRRATPSCASSLDNTLVEIQSHLRDCTVSFIIRGKGTGRHARATASLTEAALQADKLIENLAKAGVKPIRTVYEFMQDEDIWLPSFVELDDGRLLSDSLKLVAIENLPTGLSLGVTVRDVEIRDP